MSPRNAAAILAAICLTAGTAEAQQTTKPRPKTAAHAARTADSASSRSAMATPSGDTAKMTKRSHRSAAARRQKAHHSKTAAHAGMTGHSMSDSTKKSPAASPMSKP